MSSESELEVRSHVGRDLLQASQLFRTAEAAVWEYVVNAIEYVDKGMRPEVTVRVETRAKRITISDNGRGMSRGDLSHYFTMHGENLDRARGRIVRGKLGTGKSAAFGIARRLEVTTVKSGLRNVVELTRKAIEASSGGEIPIRSLVRDEMTDAPNGTVVVIDDLIAAKVSTEAIIRLIERHLVFFRGTEPKVVVDNYLCSPSSPSVASSHEFDQVQDNRHS